MFGLLLVLFAGVPARAQSNTTKKDYKIVSDDIIIESGNKVLLTEYDFKGSTIKTREKYFKDRQTQNEGSGYRDEKLYGLQPSNRYIRSYRKGRQKNIV